MIKMEHYLGSGVPMVVFMESWSPLLVFRSMFCVLVVKVLKLVSCWLCSCLSLQVNFVWVGCWFPFIMISIPLEFILKFQRFPHLLGGECGAAYMQHLHQGGWARESASLYNHPLLRYHLIMMDELNLITINLHWLGSAVFLVICFCISVLVS